MKVDVVQWLRLQWDRAMAFAAGVAGAVALIVGWFGVSGTPIPGKQLPYIISGGVGGVFLLGAGAALWLSADLRDEWQKLDRIEAALNTIAERGLDGLLSEARALANGEVTDEIVLESAGPPKPPRNGRQSKRPTAAASRRRGDLAAHGTDAPR